MTTTEPPAASSASARCAPMNTAPPVTIDVRLATAVGRPPGFAVRRLQPRRARDHISPRGRPSCTRPCEVAPDARRLGHRARPIRRRLRRRVPRRDRAGEASRDHRRGRNVDRRNPRRRLPSPGERPLRRRQGPAGRPDDRHGGGDVTSDRADRRGRRAPGRRSSASAGRIRSRRLRSSPGGPEQHLRTRLLGPSAR
jgi:hypothetical protein